MSVVSERSRKLYLSEYLQTKHHDDQNSRLCDRAAGEAVIQCILSECLHISTCLSHEPHGSTLSICAIAEGHVLPVVTLLDPALCYLLLLQLAVAVDL